MRNVVKGNCPHRDPHGSTENCRQSLSMNRDAPSPRPSPPLGERVPGGRERGIPGSWLRCANRKSWKLSMNSRGLFRHRSDRQKFSPVGRRDTSPAVQGWDSIVEEPSPEGTVELFPRHLILDSALPSELACTRFQPGRKLPGYCHYSLREKTGGAGHLLKGTRSQEFADITRRSIS